MAKKKKVPNDDTALQSRLGAAVRSHRQHLGITQEELAWRANMHRTYLADIERGGRNITLRRIANLAHALQLSVEGLLFQSSGAGGLVGPGDKTSGSGDILLVEDNPEDVELTMRAFTRTKITNPVRVVRDGEEALEFLFRRGRYALRPPGLPELVMLDLGLPKVPGLEVLRQIKADPQLRAVPVVILTVSHRDEHILESSQLGASNYIIKPVEFEKFVQVTNKLDFHWCMSRAPEPSPD